MEKSYNLFMLMFNLSQLHSKERVIKLFLEKVNQLFQPVEFIFSENPLGNRPDVITIKTTETVYGYLETDLSPKLTREDKSLLTNAIQMLAMILENLALNRKLKEERDAFECVANQRMNELTKTIVHLEKARKESGNLINDLSAEIQKRVAVEKSLRESEEKFRKLTENTTDVLWTADLKLKTTYVSPSIANLTGETVEEHLAKNTADRYTAEDFRKITEILSKEMARDDEPGVDKNRTHVVELQHLKADGKTRIWVAMHASFLRNEKGNIAGIQGVTRNIEKQKKLEAKLRQSEARYKSIISLSNTGAWEYDRVKDTLWCSPEYFKILGHNPSDFPGNLSQNWSDFLHPDDKEVALQIFSHYLEKGTEEMYENHFRMRHKNGQWRWIWSRGQTLRDKNNQLTNITVGTHIDITERKLYEENIKKSEEKYRLIFERSPLGILYFDTNGVITDCNQNFVSIIGSSRQALLGLPMLKLPDQNIVKAVSKALSGKPTSYEGIYKSVTANKTTPIRLLFAPATNAAGKAEGGVGLVEDRTLHIQSEEFKKQAEIARESVRFKQNFLANMSHEIRTPLTGVLGMIEILEQTELTAKQTEYISVLKSSGESLREIINQVLDFSKIEAGKVKLKYSTFEFSSVVKNTHRLFCAICKKDVTFSVEQDPEIPPLIRADKSRITQVIHNLISNAVKFTEKGTIRLKANLVNKSLPEDEITIRIEISDTGIGIPKAKLRNLFMPFSQIDEKDTRLHEGTGLGLSIAKELVSLHGGNMGVTSTYRKGSTFWFTFRAKKVEEHPYKQTMKPPSFSLPQKKLRILLAEDKVVNQKVITLMLTSMGHEITIARNGKECLEIFEPDLFDMILMDIQMPIMDGITATKKLKKKYKLLPPIIGLSANAFEGDKEKYIALGMDGYMTKPVKREDFTLLLGELFKS